MNPFPITPFPINPLPILRQACVALLVGLTAAGAAAEDKLYEGLLLPDDFAGPVSVVIELRDLRGVLVGSVKAGSPYSGTAKINTGEMIGDKCDFRVSFSPAVSLRFTGNCGSTLFEGRYAQLGRRDAGGRGTFRLSRKEPEKEEEKQEANPQSIGAPSVTECIMANTRCLTACPQDNYNVAFLCSNRCRSKYRTCKKNAAY